MRWLLIAGFALIQAGAVLGQGGSAAPRAGFIAVKAAEGRLAPEAQAACDLAKRLAGAELILLGPEGAFTDANDHPVALDDYRVLWYHQGDSTGTVVQARSIESLKRHVQQGNGLFLSGAALTLVNTLGVETVRPHLVSGNAAGGAAHIRTLASSHPIFKDLLQGFPWDDSVGGFVREFIIPIAGAGLSNYADFAGTGGPHQGRLLGWCDAQDANPFVEYELGRGRIIVLGWRFPCYQESPQVNRTNLHRLTGNILSYLGDSKQWRDLAPKPSEPGIGVSEAQWISLERAVRDMISTFGDRYPKGSQYLKSLELLKTEESALAVKNMTDAELTERRGQIAGQFAALRSEALFANPLLDFEKLLFIQRGTGQMGLPANFHANTELPMSGYDNQLVTLSPVQPGGTLSSLYRPDGTKFIGDVDVHFDGDRMLFSMPGANGRWQVFELSVDGSKLRQLPLIQQPDVDNYDACYLPDGRIIFTSTAPFTGVPCVAGSSHVANLYLWNTDGSIRQLTVDQDHDWCPTVANSGRVMFLRWEYTDLPHSNSRRLFQMNPDGTGQTAIFGSSSYFPPSFFYARPIPGHPSKIVGIATGHHGVGRSGRMLIVDPALGSREAEGVVQEIPGWNRQVEPIIRDTLADGVWPQFLHPYPLSEKYFLVSAKLNPQSNWGLYLADVFDNIVLLKESPGYALLEPVPLRKTATPPIIPDRIDAQSKEAVVYLSDIYAGGGLRGIARGTVKRLRLYSYNYAYRNIGGLLGAVGMDGPWDVRRILGTVPVEPDGSALFSVPANTPVAVQPLDEKGQALQLMRSWFTAMPGERVSCVGCHEQLSDSPPGRKTLAVNRAPSVIEPWYGPVRGFSFAREVQPVLDRYCVSCHNDKARSEGTPLCNLQGNALITNWWTAFEGNVGVRDGGKFSVSYAALHPFIRRPGIESDIHLLAPMEFHAETTELIQMLRKGHHNAQLDTESWDRLVTWIDLNAPYHGYWTEIFGEARVKTMASRRRDMSRIYAGVDEDPEALPAPPAQLHEAPAKPLMAEAPQESKTRITGWPFDTKEARRRQTLAGKEGETTRILDLGNGIKLDFVLIPAGEFIMGDENGERDEKPVARVKIDKPFWMSRTEIANEQFALYDPAHDSHFESMHAYQFGIHGFPVNKPRQPAVRLSWNQTMEFCRWLSARTGLHANLPTEAQWEYACRAGTDTSMWYGNLDSDFSKFANLGDASLRDFVLETYIHVRPVINPGPYDDWVPKESRFNDGGFVTAETGRYLANPWGLVDMHGNAWEWTRTTYKPYPYTEDDGRSGISCQGPKVVRGGSWYDRPKRCQSGFRLAYQAFQPVFNVGFRVILEDQSP